MTDEILRRRLTTSIYLVGKRWRKAVELQLVRHAISEMPAAALRGIACLGDGVRQNVLAQYLGIEGPSLVPIIDQLEERSLVSRQNDPGDRRAKNLWLTKEGRVLSSQIETELDVVRLKTLKGLDRSDIEAALRVLAAFEQI